MKILLLKKMRNLWRALTTIGIYDTGGVAAQKRIQVTDVIGFLCLPVMFTFAVVSFNIGHFYLTGFYALITLLVLVMIYGNYKKKSETFRIVVTFLMVVFNAAGNVLFDSGQGYYVLLVCFLSVLFYGMRPGILYLSLFYALLFFASEIIMLYVKPVEPVIDFIRMVKAINVIIAISIFLYFLYDSKKNYRKAFDEIIAQKKNLEAYNALLVQQAISLELKNKDIEELKNKNEELSEIVYHQLRSPVVTFADVLSQYIEYDAYTKEEFLDISKHIQKKVNDTMHIIDNLLSWSRKGCDGVQPVISRCEIHKVIEKATEELVPSLEKKSLKIICPAGKSQFAYADADHLFIIILNILTNAIKFSPAGGHIIIEFFEQTGKLQLHISNNGKRIEKAHLQAIFSSQHIISSKGTMNETGTGVGLKICKNLIEKNHGSIDIKSGLNNITTVMLELPVAV